MAVVPNRVVPNKRRSKAVLLRGCAPFVSLVLLKDSRVLVYCIPVGKQWNFLVPEHTLITIGHARSVPRYVCVGLCSSADQERRLWLAYIPGFFHFFNHVATIKMHPVSIFFVPCGT